MPPLAVTFQQIAHLSSIFLSWVPYIALNMSFHSVPYDQQVHFENPRVPPSATASSLTLARRDHATAVHVNVSCYTAAETIEIISRSGALKSVMRPEKTLLSAVSAGSLLTFAAAAGLRAEASPWLVENAPGLNGLLGALISPMGLVWIVLTDAELFTGVIMVRCSDAGLFPAHLYRTGKLIRILSFSIQLWQCLKAE